MAAVPPASPVVPPPGEHYPTLWMFRHHLNLTLPNTPHLAGFAGRLDILYAYLSENPEPNVDVIRQHFNAAQVLYQRLQAAQLWGVIEPQQNAWALVQAEIYTKFPALLPNNNGELAHRIFIAIRDFIPDY